MALTARQEIRVAISYIRRNRVQAELAENYGVSQATVSRAVTTWSPRIVEALNEFVPTVDDLDTRDALIVDGTLPPCWDWEAADGLYSAKHQSPGLNVQVACNLSGRLAWVSDPMPGCTHDSKALDTSGFLEVFPEDFIMGDRVC
ncbi:Helix-turn-helix of DDE superfamily endonuclease [Brevibacterium jeotgali]|uniref:Helix-turn-helix of DDE superfamily endonuclease n=1 Tax=Brevibacterium jeotgali TaxID=1262550 RepID=A0A2H1L8T5_9MICO|nr:DDE superfamily endonuclease [Brevibacterium jeotgali]SMY13302.1 Helix-turn-helix of DDE superfamily endonuclease [Brevibacterium jeotgali]